MRLARWQASMNGWNRALALARAQGSVELEAPALRGLGLTASNSGDLATAEPLLRRSLTMFEPGAKAHPQQYAAALACLGSLYRDRRKVSLAEDAWLRALEADRTSV